MSLDFLYIPRLTIVFLRRNVFNDDLIDTFVGREKISCFRSNNAKLFFQLMAKIIQMKKLKKYVNFYTH